MLSVCCSVLQRVAVCCSALQCVGDWRARLEQRRHSKTLGGASCCCCCSRCCCSLRCDFVVIRCWSSGCLPIVRFPLPVCKCVLCIVSAHTVIYCWSSGCCCCLPVVRFPLPVCTCVLYIVSAYTVIIQIPKLRTPGARGGEDPRNCRAPTGSDH